MSHKRKFQSLGLDRRVRPRKHEAEWESDPASENESDQDDVSEEGIREQQESGSSSKADSDQKSNEGGPEDSSPSESDGESEDDHNKSKPTIDLSSVSFGALARAQASLPPTSSRKKDVLKGSSHKTLTQDITRPSKKPNSAYTSDAILKTKPNPAPSRTSKHAPQEQSSKKPVSRRREILADTRRKYRDPRFDSVVSGTAAVPPLDEVKARRAYAFLDEYRDSEMADLRTQIKKTKNPDVKLGLKRELMSMESKKKARQRKDEEAGLLRDHRNKEKELVAQGKTPYYLKKSEQKKQLLTNRFDKMTKGQVDRAIERKRKKMAGKEKKELGSLQRVSERH